MRAEKWNTGVQAHNPGKIMQNRRRVVSIYVINRLSPAISMSNHRFLQPDHGVNSKYQHVSGTNLLDVNLIILVVNQRVR